MYFYSPQAHTQAPHFKIFSGQNLHELYIKKNDVHVYLFPIHCRINFQGITNAKRQTQPPLE